MKSIKLAVAIACVSIITTGAHAAAEPPALAPFYQFADAMNAGDMTKAADCEAMVRAAVDVFDHLGADPWSEMARTELAATGETARRRDVTTLSDLTPQELQIALSLAEGRTTRETAAALFLSPKTIEYHLRSVYRKLDIGSRSELKAAMAQLATG